MTRVLIVTFDAGGNVPPAIGIGQRLAKDGDDVLVLGGPSQRAVIESADWRSSRSAPSRRTGRRAL